MDSVVVLLAECERRGVRLKIQDDQVVCLTPRRDVPDDLAEKLYQYKAEILARLECDAIVHKTLGEVNDSCPTGWQPLPSDWCRLDEIQLRIDTARDRRDVMDVRRKCREYVQTAQEIFRRWAVTSGERTRRTG